MAAQNPQHVEQIASGRKLGLCATLKCKNSKKKEKARGLIIWLA